MADAITILTNNHRRPVVDAWDLTPAERADFDYVDWDAIERGEDSRSFVRAYGQVIDLNDMDGAPAWGGMPASLAGWDNYQSDSFFSGIVVRYVHDVVLGPEYDGSEYDVVVGRYFS